MFPTLSSLPISIVFGSSIGMADSLLLLIRFSHFSRDLKSLAAQVVWRVLPNVFASLLGDFRVFRLLRSIANRVSAFHFDIAELSRCSFGKLVNATQA